MLRKPPVPCAFATLMGLIIIIIIIIIVYTLHPGFIDHIIYIRIRPVMKGNSAAKYNTIKMVGLMLSELYGGTKYVVLYDDSIHSITQRN